MDWRDKQNIHREERTKAKEEMKHRAHVMSRAWRWWVVLSQQPGNKNVEEWQEARRGRYTQLLCPVENIKVVQSRLVAHGAILCELWLLLMRCWCG